MLALSHPPNLTTATDVNQYLHLPPAVYQNLWLVCGLWFGLSNGAFLWFRLRKLAKEQGSLFTQREAGQFAKWTGISIFVPALVFWLIQTSGGNGLEPNFLTWPAPQKHMALGFQVVLWLALLAYVFMANGADTMAKFMGAGRTKLLFLYTPKAFKFMAASTVVSQVATLAFGIHAMSGVAA
jgi:hypothetical protein